ncbi:MAG: hypothetical protein RM338_24475 [Nostoc sp. DedQUE12a]|nr:hypothetical protein [Nostoc sp. DedQUE12a]
MYKTLHGNTGFNIQDLEQAEQNKIFTISHSRKPQHHREQLHYFPIRCIPTHTNQVDAKYEVFNLLTAFSC